MAGQHDHLNSLNRIAEDDIPVAMRILEKSDGTSKEMRERLPFGGNSRFVTKRASVLVEGFPLQINTEISIREARGSSRLLQHPSTPETQPYRNLRE
jgi:hypothetical protein